ncbi:hypothetical protein GPECTOR_438g319 [Gonium pectorale]|uniref:Uncharacterized protein n=1 Tax=Gonium pectorale TaxID=33097 RepID=A0A150FWA3_GONPE|nr:hypothetical protein GPECTOR_438g319 [Gonium pectorale]|eukprot:KXZ41485.1 hypothetical protein GPECTOR_438g319 [Gonium pectorale]
MSARAGAAAASRRARVGSVPAGPATGSAAEAGGTRNALLSGLPSEVQGVLRDLPGAVQQMSAAAAGPSGAPGGGEERSPIARLGSSQLRRLEVLVLSLLEFAATDELSGKVAAAVLLDGSVRLALLRLSLAAVELAPREVLGEGLARQGRARVAVWTQRLIKCLLSKAAAAGPSGAPGGGEERSPIARLGSSQLRRLEVLVLSLLEFAATDELSGKVAAAVLLDGSVRLALLRLSLAAVELAPREVLGEGLARQGRARVAVWTQRLIKCLLSKGRKVAAAASGASGAAAGAAARAEAGAGSTAAALLPFVAFARAMLRLRLLHAASRQLAAFGDALGLTPAAVRETAVGPGAADGGGQRSWWEEVGSSPGGNSAVSAMLSTAHAGYNLVRSVCDLPGICSHPWATRSAAPEHMTLALELGAALGDSAFMEHAARAQLLLAQLVPPMVLSGEGDGGGVRGGGGGSDDGLTMGQQELHITAASCQESIVKLALLLDMMADGSPQPVPHGEDAAAGASSALQQVLYGRFVHTARLCIGVAALCAADGGPAYGLPQPLLFAVMAFNDMFGRDHAGGAGAGAGAGGGGGMAAGDGVVSATLYACVLLSVSVLLRKETQPAPPGKRAVCALVLRIGRLALASLPPLTGPPAVEAEAEPRTEAGGVGGSGGALSSQACKSCGRGGDGTSSGTGGAGGSGSEGCAVVRTSPYTAAAATALSGGGGSDRAIAAGSAPTSTLARPRRLLATTNAACLCCTALSAARRQLRRRDGARDSATWRADAAECWRLATAAVRHAPPHVSVDTLMDLRDGFLWLWWETARAAPIPERQPFPDAPPPLVAAALDAGVLPCLERLLRCASRAPDGPEAAFCRGVFAHLNSSSYAMMALLLAYGDPRQAAALVATLGKLAQATGPRVTTDAWAPDEDSRQCLLRLVCWTMQATCAVYTSQLRMLHDAASAGHDTAGPGHDTAGPGHDTAGPGHDAGGISASEAAGPTPGDGLTAPGAAGPTTSAVSSSPGAAVPGRALRQLGRLVPLALATVLLPLACLALPAVEEALRQQRAAVEETEAPPPTLALGRGSLGSLVPALLNSLFQVTALCVSGDAAPAAVAEGASGSGDAPCTGWLSLLLEEARAVELLWAALELAGAGAWVPLALPQPPPPAAADAHQEVQEGREEEQEDSDGMLIICGVVEACAVVAAILGAHGTTTAPAGLKLGHVHEAPADAGVDHLHEAPAGAGGAVLGAGGSNPGPGAAAAVSRSNAGDGLAPPRQPPPWRPELLRAVAGRLRAAGSEDSGVMAEQLAAMLDAWGGGGQPRRDGTGDVEGGAAAGDGEARAVFVPCLTGTPPPHPGEARRLLRTCANPRCANLEGDSEADLALWECGSAAGPGGSVRIP